MTATQNPTSPSWHPPIAGTEAEHLTGVLDRQRATFRWKAADLDPVALRRTIGASAMTLGGLLKHLAFVEDLYLTARLQQTSPGKPWEDVDWEAEPGVGLELGGIRHSRAALRAPRRGDRQVAGPPGRRDRRRHVSQVIDLGWSGGNNPNLRRLICDLIEEYGRYIGHADLLREAVDGRVAEHPPMDLVQHETCQATDSRVAGISAEVPGRLRFVRERGRRARARVRHRAGGRPAYRSSRPRP